MRQDDPDRVSPGEASKLAPNSRPAAQPRPVTRLNRRMLAVLVGGVATAVLGATLWSLQAPQRRGAGESTELYNVDRVSRSEGLAQLPTDYSQLPPTLPPLPPSWANRCPATSARRSCAPNSERRVTHNRAMTRPRPSAWRGSRRPRKRRLRPCSSARADSAPP